MARPLAPSDPFRGGLNGSFPARPAADSPVLDETRAAAFELDAIEDPAQPPGGGAVTESPEVQHLRVENNQLRNLCAELEQALQEATQHHHGHELEGQIKE